MLMNAQYTVTHGDVGGAVVRMRDEGEREGPVLQSRDYVVWCFMYDTRHCCSTDFSIHLE